MWQGDEKLATISTCYSIAAVSKYFILGLAVPKSLESENADGRLAF